jgi:hypothetical protein
MITPSSFNKGEHFDRAFTRLGLKGSIYVRVSGTHCSSGHKRNHWATLPRVRIQIGWVETMVKNAFDWARPNPGIVAISRRTSMSISVSCAGRTPALR